MVLVNRLTRRLGIKYPIVFMPLDAADAADVLVCVDFSNVGPAGRLDRLELALAHKPKAVMLAADDLAAFVERIREAGAAVVIEVGDLGAAHHVLDLGADILVARGTMALVSQVADLISRRSYDALVLAADGIVDGRGLAAALMLGADGVMITSPAVGDLIGRMVAQAELLLEAA